MRSINIKQESVKQIIESLNVLLLAYKETLDFFSYQIKNISNRFVEVEDEITVKLSKLFALDKMVGENVLKMEKRIVPIFSSGNYNRIIELKLRVS